MSKKHLNDYLSSRSEEEGAEREALKAYLTVLKHKGILEGKDLDALADIAANGKSERDRVRAAEMLTTARQKASDALAHNTALREEVMDAKGLKPNAPQLNVVSFQAMDLEKLRALAEGKPLLTPAPPVLLERVVEVEKAQPEPE